jgi:hypothetical protein
LLLQSRHLAAQRRVLGGQGGDALSQRLHGLFRPGSLLLRYIGRLAARLASGFAHAFGGLLQLVFPGSSSRDHEFNNDGPLGPFFRYIGDTGTYIARYDDLFNGKEEKIDVSQVDVSTNGIELQDREFFAAIREGREPNASVAQVRPCYEVLHRLEQQLRD